jgi:hypothetical protein
MTAETQLPEDRDALPAIDLSPFAITLLVVALAAIGGWLHTVHELNRLVAREVVRGEALRQLHAANSGLPAAQAGAQLRHSRADD